MPEGKRRSAQLVVIGAGPGGYPAGFYAADHGLDVVMIDPELNPGGTCLYRGCIPSKALLHVADFLAETKRAREWGVTVGEPRVDIDRLRGWKDEVVSKLTGGLGQLCRQRDIQYVRGRARFMNDARLEVSPLGGERYELDFDHAIIATGSVATTLPGTISSPRVMDATRALDLEEIPQRLLVIGGGYIGLELGQLYAGLGSQVTLVEMLPDLLTWTDKDLVNILMRKVTKQFKGVLLETKVVDMEEGRNGISVRFEGPESGSQPRLFDRVLVAVGRKPFTGGLGLDTTGVKLNNKGFVEVNAQRQTSVSTIYAVGDVVGDPLLAHKATHEAPVAVDAILGKPAAFDPKAIPAVIYSDPEIAYCGLTEDEANRTGRDVHVTRFPWGASGRAATLGRPEGVTKLVLEPDTGVVLGVGIVGVHAGELIAQGVQAVEMGATAEDLALMVHAHPTLSETIMEAAEAFVGHSTHFYGRKSTPTAKGR